jgi:threonine dehydratase
MPIEPILSTIHEAQQLLSSHFPPTRLIPVNFPNAQAFLKLETDLPTASFKPRGAFYALSTNLRKRAITEVTASSTGNHGAAVAWAAKTLGIPATIFLPTNPNPVKRKRIAELGANLIECGGQDLAHAFSEAQKYSVRPGIYFLNDATDPDLPAGSATIGLEILKQLPEVAAIYVPMGDTALIRGVAAAVRQINPKVKILGVQTERAPSYYLSWRAGHAVPTETCDTCADGLATRTPEPSNVEKIRELVDDIILVNEDQMLEAIRILHQRANVIAEPAGAAATAAFLKSNPISTSISAQSLRYPAVLLVTGANITDPIRQRAGLSSFSKLR